MVEMDRKYKLQNVFEVNLNNAMQTFNFYTYGALIGNEFVGVHGGRIGQFYACPHSNDPSDPECQQYVGRYIVESMGFPTNWLWRPILVAISFAIALFFGAGLLLTFRKVDIDIAQSCKTIKGISGKQVTVSPSSRGVRRIAIGLNRFELEVRKRYLWKWSYGKTILNPITASFGPGHINAIMGPSGSGKTTLLQGLAHRLDGTIFSKYRSSGDITLNNAIPSTSVLESVVSYVAQGDGALLPLLTVRETLRFAAVLRLPPSMSKKEKHQRAEDVILRMDLKDCANNLIGNEVRRGISDGEKRRVSIGVQILMDPKILLLDEPTSGLDVFSATSVIEVLKALAEEGRTVIMTTHETRSDIFKSFYNVILLAQGGSIAYSGQCQHMLAHFQKMGFECPHMTNPADFALGLITVDLQQEGGEEADRKKVQRIIQQWDASQQTLPKATSHVVTPTELSSLEYKMNPFRVTFPLILRRSAINIMRNPGTMVARAVHVVATGALCSVFFAPLQSNAESIQTRMVSQSSVCLEQVFLTIYRAFYSSALCSTFLVS
jgi:ABC-type multidrug transport system ATPase subunit